MSSTFPDVPDADPFGADGDGQEIGNQPALPMHFGTAIIPECSLVILLFADDGAEFFQVGIHVNRGARMTVSISLRPS